MRQFRSHAHFLRPIAAVLLAFSLHGCMRWREVPEPKTLASHPGTVRLTILGERRQVIAKGATVVGDSLVWNHPQRTTVPLARVTFVEARSLDPVATGFFTLVGAAFLVSYAIVNK